jgi:hypothetical protein
MDRIQELIEYLTTRIQREQVKVLKEARKKPRKQR